MFATIFVKQEDRGNKKNYPNRIRLGQVTKYTKIFNKIYSISIVKKWESI